MSKDSMVRNIVNSQRVLKIGEWFSATIVVKSTRITVIFALIVDIGL